MSLVLYFFDFSIKDIQEKIGKVDKEFVKSLKELESGSKFESAKELPKDIVSFSAGATKLNVFKKEDNSERKYFEYDQVFGEGGARERAEKMCEKAKKAGKNRFVSDGLETPTIIRKGFTPPERTQYDN